jgi:Ser/Thr protein kinase RdoA (MazF antagonist)
MNDMNITSAQYTRDFEGNNSGIQATIDGQELFVPLDEANRHYAEILRQVAAGTLIIAYAV